MSKGNEMPKLEAGMVLKIDIGDGIIHTYLYINEVHMYNVSGKTYNTGVQSYHKVLAIYSATSGSFEDVANSLESRLIWKRNTETEDRIEQLEATINKASEELQSLKESL